MSSRSHRVAGALVAAVAVLLAAACGKQSGDGPAGGSTAGAAPSGSSSAAASAKTGFTPPDPSKIGMECKRNFDCPSMDYKSACEFKCQRLPKVPDTEPGYCQLNTVTGVVGAGPCDGYQIGVTRIGGAQPDAKTAAIYFCDIDSGVFCDSKTHRCAAVKALGAACGDGDNDCGKDAVCDSATKACVAAAAVGESCKEKRCSSAGYCGNEKTCVARKADGEQCGESDQCRSLTCVAGNGPPVCKARTPPTACTL